MTLAAAVQIAVDRLAAEDAAAAQLLRLCALLAPEPVPVELFANAPDGVLPLPLASLVGSTLPLRRTLARIGRYGLARIDPPGPQLHRLTQAVVLSLLDEPARETARTQVEHLLAAGSPGASDDPGSWRRWARFLPHLLAINPTNSRNPALRQVTYDGCYYLLEHGDLHAGHQFAEHIYRQWRAHLGPDAADTLDAAHLYALAATRLGNHAEALALGEDTLQRQMRVLGRADSRTLRTANTVGMCLYQLGRPDQASTLHEQTLRQLRELCGEDDILALGVAHNLALDWGATGHHEKAFALNQDTFSRRRRILGDDHPHTLLSAADVARDLFTAGRVTKALELHRDTLARRQRVLGPDHPNTLHSANSLAVIMYHVGALASAFHWAPSTS